METSAPDPNRGLSASLAAGRIFSVFSSKS